MGVKRVPLIELLTVREIVHPTRITQAAWSAGGWAIEAQGHAWWRAPYGPPLDGTIRLEFGGFGDGAIVPWDFDPTDDEALEDFRVERIEEVGWAQARDRSIYCAAPIPSPLELYLTVDDHLATAGAFRRPSDFLNQADRLSSFMTMCGTGGFLLGRAPAAIADLLCAELERQGVAHNVLPSEDDDPGAFLVRLGRSVFMCDTAEAVFEAG